MSEPNIVVAIEDARTAGVPRAGDQRRTSLELHATPPFRANLVLTVVDNADLSFGQWQRASDEALPLLLESYELLDVQKVRVAGRPGGWRLARHLNATGDVLVMQQWFTTFGHLGITLTATCDLGSYRLLLPETQAAASSLARRAPVTPC